MYGEERAPESQWADAIRRRLPPMDADGHGAGPCSSIGFPVPRAVVPVVSRLEAYDGARDAAPRADSAAARAGQHVMAAAIVPAHQIGLDGPLTEHHGHRILNVSWRDIAMRVDLP